MKIINDIKLNFNTELLNFYEWKEEDNIDKYNNISICKLSNNNYLKLIKNKIKVEKEFLKEINNNICLFCNDYDSLCIMFDDEGYSYKYSKLTLEDENKIYRLLLKEKINNIKFKTISNLNYSFYNRDIKEKINSITYFIKNNESNKDMLKYISLECFNRVIPTNKLIDQIFILKEDEIDKIFNLIKIIHV